MNTDTLVSIRDLHKHFDISGGWLDQLRFSGGRFARRKTLVQAVNGVSFDILEGETVSVVGESGCGKSTLARTVMRLYPPQAGEVHYRGRRIDHLSREQFKPYRTRMQMIFQDPYASLNPRMRVRQILEEPIRFHRPKTSGSEVLDQVAEIMQQVGVDPEWRERYPHEFSGGQRQRISIARALAVDPEFIVADEPIAALDVSIQAQILNLMMELQEKRRLTYLFISHDLSVVAHISNRVAVMYLGTLCELGSVRLPCTAPSKTAAGARPHAPRQRAVSSETLPSAVVSPGAMARAFWTPSRIVAAPPMKQAVPKQTTQVWRPGGFRVKKW